MMQEEEDFELLSKLDLADSTKIETYIPSRLDRLPWSPFHWFVVISLGITWILDGLEVSLVSVVAAQLTDPGTLNFTEFEVGLAGTVYIAGAILGSLFFGYLTERYGRKKLYLATPVIYLIATGATGLTQNFWTFCICRFFTGAGIGGEYSSINSTIDELIPARVRGVVDLAINGSYWLGAALGSVASLFFLDTALLPIDVGWRLGFGIGGIIGVVIIALRIKLPESPRWLLVHDRAQEAEENMAKLEEKIQKSTGRLLDPPNYSVTIHQRKTVGIRNVVRVMFKIYPKRTILGVVLMSSQAFFYNAVFFSNSLVLTKFHGVNSKDVGLYLIPFAIGNFMGPLLLGKYFDTFGRRKMMFTTYELSAITLTITGILFATDTLNAITQTICWAVVFVFSSPAASSAYLTVSEIFPLEVRAIAIAVFYSLGTSVGGLLGPALFGKLIETESAMNVFYGYLLGAFFMAVAGVTALLIGVDAEQKSLEMIAIPLSAHEDGIKNVVSPNQSFNKEEADSSN